MVEGADTRCDVISGAANSHLPQVGEGGACQRQVTDEDDQSRFLPIGKNHPYLVDFRPKAKILTYHTHPPTEYSFDNSDNITSPSVPLPSLREGATLPRIAEM